MTARHCIPAASTCSEFGLNATVRGMAGHAWDITRELDVKDQILIVESYKHNNYRAERGATTPQE
jgi:hypothetical protein